MNLTIQVLNLPEVEPLEAACLAQNVRADVVESLESMGYKFGSGYSVWAFEGV